MSHADDAWMGKVCEGGEVVVVDHTPDWLIDGGLAGAEFAYERVGVEFACEVVGGGPEFGRVVVGSECEWVVGGTVKEEVDFEYYV